MRFGSVCSGIEAASVAWNPIGWKAQWLAEIEPFPCSLLAHHYPDTPNLGDMTKFNEWPTDDKHAIDLLCGGTPCQSFSVAGLRKGLDDPRGNLMLTFGAIAAKYRPKWLVWENVPGVLSSNGGADFGSFLGLLGILGYGFAYRVLDAQYFGVAQRRRRVFVVGCLGDWRSAAAVLFERHSLQGHPAPSRQAGQEVAGTFGARTTAGGGFGGDFETTGGLRAVEVAGTMKSCKDSGGWSNSADHAAAGYMVPVGIFQDSEFGVAQYDSAGTLRAGRIPEHQMVMQPVPHADISPALKARDGKGPSSDGDGDGAILVPMVSRGVTIHGTDKTVNVMSFTDCAGSLRTKPPGSIENSSTTACLSPVGFAQNQRDEVRMMHVAGALAAEPGMKQQTYCLDINKSANEGSSQGVQVDHSNTLRTQKVPAVSQGMQVRRLTPTECERLQGFPDGYTNVPHRGKPAADGPRYKALGNSWAVPNVRWIGQRIDAVSEIQQMEIAA